MLVQAYIIYNAHSNTYVNDGSVVTLNCDRLQSYTPRQCWLQRWLPAGDGTDIIYQLTFNLSSADQTQYGTNLIQGLYVEQDGQGVMIDVLDMTTFLNGCDACCGGATGVMTRFYTSIPDFSAPTEQIYCITRSDDGSSYAVEQLGNDYASQFHGNLKVRSSISGTTRYQVTSFTGYPPVAQGTDVVASGPCP